MARYQVDINMPLYWLSLSFRGWCNHQWPSKTWPI